MVAKNSFKLSALVFAATCFGIAMVNAQDCARNYTVQPGDVCNKISAAQNVSTYQLATVNKAIIDPACDNLMPGEVICLGLVGQDCTTVHVIQTGDDCSTIASQASITVGELLIDNPNVNANCTNIYVEEVLCVAPVTNITSA